MNTHSRHQRPLQEIDGESADLFDYELIRDWVGYARGALDRRRWLAFWVGALVMGAAAGSLLVLPKDYHVEVHLQAQRNQVIGTLGTGKTMAWDWDDPAKTAPDLIVRQDNLVALVRETDLVKRWDDSRAPLLKLKDWISEHLRGPLTDVQKEDVMVATLEQRLTVTPGEGTVIIAVDWNNAQLAYRLAQAATESYLDARRVVEVAVVSEAIGLLDSHAADERVTINRAVDEIVKMREHAESQRPASTVSRKPGRAVPSTRRAAPSPAQTASAGAAAAAATPRKEQADPELGLLRAQLQGKQNAIDDIEEFRRRHISELQGKLAELKQVYSEGHPAVIDLQEQIQTAERQEPTQLAGLRAEYKHLEDEYQRRGGAQAEMQPDKTAAPVAISRLTSSALRAPKGSEEEGPELEQAKNDLKYELGKYQSLQDRIDTAKMERDTQRAAFSYRYSVLRPAALPTSPKRPRKPLVLGGGLIAALLFGVMAALLAEIRSDRIIERWQIERHLQLGVLAEIRRP